MKQNVKITTEKETLPDIEILAEHIEALSKVGEKLKKSRLNERTIILLLKDSTGLYGNQIQKVLDALPELKKRYLK
jgi:hypothetical protein